MGGAKSELSLPQETCMYSASLDSLIASSAKETSSQPQSVWKRIQSIPIGFCHPSVFGNMLIAVGVSYYKWSPLKAVPQTVHGNCAWFPRHL